MQAKRAASEQMWQEACSCNDGSMVFNRTRRDKRWFCDTICNGNGQERSASDSVWDLIDSMPLSRDPLALVAAVPALRSRFWAMRTLNVPTSLGDLVEHGRLTNPSQKDALNSFVCSGLRTGVSNAVSERAQLVVVTDAGQDLDDEMAFVLMRALSSTQQLQLKGVVATLAPERARARLVRGTLNMLGFENVPVACGSDGGFTKYSALFEKTSQSYIPADDSFATTNGSDLLLRLYESAPSSGLELLVIASLKDVAMFMRANEALFAKSTRSCTIMGGVMPFEQNIDDEFLVPDSAHNNEFCRESAEYVYRRCQETGVKLIIVSRDAAYPCPMPRSIYGPYFLKLVQCPNV